MIKAKVAQSTYYQGKMYRVGELVELADADFYALGVSVAKVSGGEKVNVEKKAEPKKDKKAPEAKEVKTEEKAVEAPEVNEMVNTEAEEKKVKVITK
jgi:hypothetical protein